MFINSISIGYGFASNARNMVSNNTTSPAFRSKMAISKPILHNESGAKILDRVTNLIKLLPDSSKMSKPSILSLIEEGVEKTYGILIDKKTIPNLSKVIIKDMSESKEWDAIKDKGDIIIASIDSKTGRMLSGEYYNLKFYRGADKLKRTLIIDRELCVPMTYGGEVWTAGQHVESLDHSIGNSALGSIFRSMIDHDASILAK